MDYAMYVSDFFLWVIFKNIVWYKEVWLSEWVYALLRADACYLSKRPTLMCSAKKQTNKQKTSEKTEAVQQQCPRTVYSSTDLNVGDWQQGEHTSSRLQNRCLRDIQRDFWPSIITKWRSASPDNLNLPCHKDQETKVEMVALRCTQDSPTLDSRWRAHTGTPKGHVEADSGKENKIMWPDRPDYLK